MKTCIRLLFVVAVLLAVGCSRLGRTAEEMRQTIACADSMNKAYVPMDSLAERLQAAADYYDRFGTANEQVRAHYLLGCVYRDRGEAPEALQHYHDATDRADTTATDCDFSLLARVHGQMAELFNLQNMYKQALKEDRLAEKLSWKANDTLAAIAFIESQCADYDESTVEGADSILCLSKRAHRLYMALGEEQKANVASAPAINIYLSRGYYDKAKELIDKFEYQSEFSDSLLGRIPSYDVFYYNKGLYFLSIRQYDSASYYFRKEMSLSVDANNKNLALGGLYYVYRDLNIKDSIVKYADKYRHSVENTVTTLVYDNLQKVESQYNYSRHQHIAQQKEVEASRYRHLVFILLFLFVSVIIIVSVIIYAARLKKQAEINHREQEYKHHVEQLEKTMNDALKLKESHFHELLCQKEADINLLQKKISGYELAIGHETTIDERLVNTDIYHHLKYVLTHPKENMEKADWDALTLTINKLLPDFYAMMHARASISVDEYHICMLVRLYFSPADIARFIGLSRASITTKRQELLRKVFGQEGKARQFDQMVRRIGHL